ncbi:MAG: fluoride efflux transporter CrcB [Chitinophagales bacterium]|nr:fluoride efflux transporter CrcB [Chitinophagales bacterium]MCZ2393353.1 fluoride efflux transporter CrcB [Chitinophagales bacterium]
MSNLIYVGIGGAAGSILRYLISLYFSNYNHHSFPKGTFIVNALGCLLIGISIGIIEKYLILSEYRLLLITGFCGGFTTFSTFSFESIMLFNNGHIMTAISYILLSVITGIVLIALGLYLTKI